MFWRHRTGWFFNKLLDKNPVGVTEDVFTDNPVPLNATHGITAMGAFAGPFGADPYWDDLPWDHLGCPSSNWPTEPCN